MSLIIYITMNMYLWIKYDRLISFPISFIQQVDTATLLPYPREINHWWLGCYDIVSHSSSGNSVTCSPEIEALDAYGIMPQYQGNRVMGRKEAECRIISNILQKTAHRSTTSRGSFVYDTKTITPFILLGIYLQWISRYFDSTL